MWGIWLVCTVIGIWVVFTAIYFIWSWKIESKKVQRHKDWLVFKRKHLRQCPWCLDGCGLDFKQEEWEEFFLPYAYWCERTQNIWLGY